ncbi:hypothetical protein MHBO_004103 [Bonamia ostreae]|uniref:Uncharacterized protein n=1 Tax=Bonamia ostreae TaxID=126728 RepID=A0ABV2ASY4_9EUKA
MKTIVTIKPLNSRFSNNWALCCSEGSISESLSVLKKGSSSEFLDFSSEMPSCDKLAASHAETMSFGNGRNSGVKKLLFGLEKGPVRNCRCPLAFFYNR